MSPVSHLLISWVVADAAGLTRRDRTLVALAGLVPVFDGVGIVVEILTEKTTAPLLWWSKYHHVLGHNIGFGLVLLVAVTLLSLRKWKTAFFAFLVFHLHLFCDLIGSRGPEGYQWPIPYFFPFSDKWQFTWDSCGLAPAGGRILVGGHRSCRRPCSRSQSFGNGLFCDERECP